VDEKDFVDALYAVMQRLIEYPVNYKQADFLAFLKCMHLVFVQKRQFSNEVIIAFARRLATLQVYLPKSEQAGILLLLKQMIEKYPALKSAFLEVEDDSIDKGFGPRFMYRGDINDPTLANASQTHSFFELL
jgi:hypothetical protein